MRNPFSFVTAYWVQFNNWIAEPFDRSYKARKSREKAARAEVNRMLKQGVFRS